MKFAFLIYSYFPYGGQQRDFLRIVRECVDRGHEIVVYTRKWQGDRPDGVRIEYVPVRSPSRTRMYRRFSQWVTTALEKNPVDAVVGFNKMPGLDIYFAADPCFAEKAETQRGAYYRYTPRFRHFSSYEQAVFGNHSSTRVLVLSPQQRSAFEHYYPGCRDRLTLIPPGIDSDRRPGEDAPRVRQALRDELDLAQSDLLVIQIGSGFRVKGVDRALAAVAALPAALRSRVTYLLIGQDNPARYLRLSRKLGIADRFRVLPGRDDIPRFLFGADLLLHPAYGESAGYALVEAVIAGLPVLTTSTCGYAFHVERAAAGLVCGEPFSQHQLNARLAEMLTSPQRETWRQNGLEYGRREDLYSLARVAANRIEEFAGSLARHGQVAS